MRPASPIRWLLPAALAAAAGCAQPGGPASSILAATRFELTAAGVATPPVSAATPEPAGLRPSAMPADRAIKRDDADDGTPTTAGPSPAGSPRPAPSPSPTSAARAPGSGGSGGGRARATPTPAPGVELQPLGEVLADPAASETAVVADAFVDATPARPWATTDVHAYELEVRVHDADLGEFVPLAPPLTRTLAQRPAPSLRASFPELVAGERYRVRATARGNAGGTASTAVLNGAAAATVELDPADPAGPRERPLPVALDPVPFAINVRLPSNVGAATPLPTWITQLTARLYDLAGSAPATPVATAVWTRDKAAYFRDVRGGRRYALELDVKSTAGTTTGRIAEWSSPRAPGAPQDVTPVFPALVPPTGTLLASWAIAGGAFGVAVDPLDRVWLTSQNANSLAARDFGGTLVIDPAIAIAGQPRAIAIDPASGDVWVAALVASKLARVVNGALAATYDTGPFPSGVAVDGQGRVWVANLLGDSVSCFQPDGTQLAGSPFAVGSQPAGVAVDRASGTVWVANSGSHTVSRIANGVVSTVALPNGSKPGGIAVAADGTAWVVGNGDGRLRRIAPDGTLQATTTNVGVGATAIAFDPVSGAAWVGQANGQRLARVRPDATLHLSVPSGAFPNTLTVDRRGHVWVAGGGMLAEHAP